MLKVRMDYKRDMLRFDCPECGAEDVIHIKQNRDCYQCQKRFRFSVPDMVLSKKVRYSFHFRNRNSGRVLGVGYV